MKKVKFRRRRQGKTDYKTRLALLASKLPRLVVRKTNLYIIGELMHSKEAQDSVECYTNSKELLQYGWQGSMKNLPAAYLAGFLLGCKAKDKEKKAILDIGLQNSTKGSRIYAFVKGAIDAGLSIKCKQEMFPSEERIKGKDTKAEARKNFSVTKEKIKEKWSKK